MACSRLVTGNHQGGPLPCCTLDSTFPAAGSTKVSSKSALLLIGAKEKSGSGHVAVGLRTVMSEANLAVVREIYRAFAEHRFPAQQLAENFAWKTHHEQPGGGTTGAVRLSAPTFATGSAGGSRWRQRRAADRPR